MAKISTYKEAKQIVGLLAEKRTSFASAAADVARLKKGLEAKSREFVESLKEDRETNGKPVKYDTDLARAAANDFASKKKRQFKRLAEQHPHLSTTFREMSDMYAQISESREILRNPLTHSVARSWSDPSKFATVTALVNAIPINSQAQWMALKAQALSSPDFGAMISLAMQNRLESIPGLKSSQYPVSPYELARQVNAEILSQVDELYQSVDALWMDVLKVHDEIFESDRWKDTRLGWLMKQDVKKRQQEASGEGESKDDDTADDSKNSDGSVRVGNNTDDLPGDTPADLKQKAEIRANKRYIAEGTGQDGDSLSRISRGLKKQFAN